MQNELNNSSSFFFIFVFIKKLGKKSEACMNVVFMHKFGELIGTYTIELTSTITDDYRIFTTSTGNHTVQDTVHELFSRPNLVN